VRRTLSILDVAAASLGLLGGGPPSPAHWCAAALPPGPPRRRISLPMPLPPSARSLSSLSCRRLAARPRPPACCAVRACVCLHLFPGGWIDFGGGSSGSSTASISASPHHLRCYCCEERRSAGAWNLEMRWPAGATSGGGPRGRGGWQPPRARRGARDREQRCLRAAGARNGCRRRVRSDGG
jgi:hypothetical protein